MRSPTINMPPDFSSSINKRGQQNGGIIPSFNGFSHGRGKEIYCPSLV
jgi:hypothetical protein